MTDSTNSETTATAIETAATADRVIVLDVVGLQPHHIDAKRTPTLESFFPSESVTNLRPPFPAVTVPAQTTLATGQSPGEHGDVSSGEYDRERDAAEFWERDRDGRDRLWETASDEAGLTTGVLNFQHLIGTSADVAVTPSPIEDENNDILEMNCWTNPDGFYDDLREELNHFPLHNYWGPGANEAGSRWILAAASEAIDRFDPDLLWIYVPHLDYVGQSDGPESDAFDEELAVVDDLLAAFLDFLSETERWDETVLTLVSEYGFHEVDHPVFPNRAFREAGLLETDDDGDVNLPASDAFAMVDHQIAHVYIDGSTDAAREALAGLEGIDAVLDESAKADRGIDHPNAGELVLVAEPDSWFQYYWWTDRANAPPYATEMDIHAKPGFDPCELFFGDEGLVSLDASQISGSHGRVDESAFGAFGLGGPAAPAFEGEESVDATDVTPTIVDLLGLEGKLAMNFAGSSLRRDRE
ncbi:nucleotide pyrophosphatase/phosphodiesterase family protein [Natrinema sp. SYSU A 869]|uniref:alkaline phosphatase family protein n=1 Tax=Natrinema sp. SYSU A 869 TaxID=2871694 RepID=UPI001CA3F860|nr:nucleotide pyrophosphatase/phosphodiesterase family protein [Natrinema sp. SYSU A 869]